MKHCFTLVFLLFLQQSYAQITPIPTSPGTYGTVVNGTSTIVTGIFRAKMEQDRRNEQEETEEYYRYLVAAGDSLYKHQNYNDAIIRYDEASRLKQQEQYPRDQIAKARVALARKNGDPYQLLVDRGDSLFTEMYYAEAIDRYNEALAIQRETYPQTRIAAANKELARWKTVHFSGLPIAEVRSDTIASRAFSDDPYSDFVPAGKYPWIDRQLTYANFRTLDGIAVPAGVRLIIYSERDFKGETLLDVTGPAIICNGQLQSQPAVLEAQSAKGPESIQKAFPEKTRVWSSRNMRDWINGSMEIIAL